MRRGPRMRLRNGGRDSRPDMTVLYEEEFVGTGGPAEQGFYNDETQEQFVTIDENGVVIEDKNAAGSAVSTSTELVIDKPVLPLRDPLTNAACTARLIRPECTSSSGNEIIYSSLPPELNVENIQRMTRTPLNGEHLEIMRVTGGRLRIRSLFGLMDDSAETSHYNLECPQTCVVCCRTISPSEMFVNFPDCLDRRRIWGSILGFQYKDMLRVRLSRMVTAATNVICTDHFSEECFRQYNFNKAAVEALGVPQSTSPKRLRVTMRPWSCTVCRFTSCSVHDTYEHMWNEHAHDVTLFLDRRNGISCPFCRKCTYGYRTPNGFQRHLKLPPTDHGHLRKIWEQARQNCRSAVLEPLAFWDSWNEKNVCLAYYGCEPQHLISPRKRKLAEHYTPEETKTSRLGESPTRTIEVCESPEPDEDDPPPRLEPESGPIVPQSSAQSLADHPYVRGTSPEVLRGSATETSAYRKLPVSSLTLNKGPGFSTLEDALGSDESHGVVFDSEDIVTKPFELWRGPYFGEIYDERMLHRQAQAVEARLRLFGESRIVEVPPGYKQINTVDGPRLVAETESGRFFG